MPVEIFRALGDPIRIKIVERLSHESIHTISSLSKGLKMSRQGARKHIQILADSNLIKLMQQGRTTVVELDRETLDKGKQFITRLEKQWEKRLDALKKFVEEDK